ncbi:MAG: hypothetical protein KW788_00520 [Candidatus Doudnabacteria bacterium]|nr:hypothetical protein [Candidatus Doudnabacteria bacterium]
MPGFRVYYTAVDDNGNESIVAKSFAPRMMEVNLINKAVRDCHDAIHNHTDLGPIDTRFEGRDSNDWRPISKELRKGKIAIAYLKTKRIREGMTVGHDLRSELGNIVIELNKQHPGLDVDLDEVLELTRDIIHFVTEFTCRPRSDKDTVSTARQRLAGI